MARRVEVSFRNPSITTDMECCLYNLPNNDWIFNVDFEKIYKIATNSQRKKLNSLKNDRNLEIVINLNIDNFYDTRRNDVQQKIYNTMKKNKVETEIINLLKEVELFDYYKSKDVDKEENKPSIFLIDRKVLLDDVNYILNNQNEYVDKDSIHYDDELEFIEKIKQLQNKLK